MKGDGFYFSANGKYWGDKNDKVIEAVIKKNQVADYQRYMISGKTRYLKTKNI